MNRRSVIKKELGPLYTFEKHQKWSEVLRLIQQNKPTKSDLLISALTAGCVKLVAVLYPGEGRLHTGYDLYVRENTDDRQWICYDHLTDSVERKDSKRELAMFRTLDQYIQGNGLSYTDCQFMKLSGKPGKPKEGV